MLLVLWRALRAHRWLALLGAGYILSSLGNGLTFVIVFGELLHLDAAVSSLALAYVLSTLPGWLGSMLGERLCRRCSPFFILILGELVGLSGLVVPAAGVLHHSIPLLLLAQTLLSLVSGMTFPAMSLIFKRGLAADELAAATCLETLIFASHVLLGVGAGVLLYPRLAPLTLLLIDAFSFALAAGLLGWSWRVSQVGGPGAAESQPGVFVWTRLSPKQKHSMLLLPVLALVGAPAMALLPALMAPAVSVAPATALPLGLLFARSLGQLLGPLLLPARNLKRYSHNNLLLLGCLGVFIGCYGLITRHTGGYQAMTLVVVAHVASNVVFTLAMFGLLNNFSSRWVSLASARAYRWQTLVGGAMSLLAGALADRIGPAAALYWLCGAAFSVAALWLLSRAVRAPRR